LIAIGIGKEIAIMFVAAGGAAIEDRDNDNPIELGIDEKRSTA